MTEEQLQSASLGLRNMRVMSSGYIYLVPGIYLYIEYHRQLCDIDAIVTDILLWYSAPAAIVSSIAQRIAKTRSVVLGTLKLNVSQRLVLVVVVTSRLNVSQRLVVVVTSRLNVSQRLVVVVVLSILEGQKARKWFLKRLHILRRTALATRSSTHCCYSYRTPGLQRRETWYTTRAPWWHSLELVQARPR